jgi:cobalt/nickel transport system permease protein
MGNLMSRAYKMSNDVYAAMLARGFGGEIRSYSEYRMAAADWISLAAVGVLGTAVALSGRILP